MPEAETTQRRFVVDKQTLVPIGLVVGAATVLLYAAVWVTDFRADVLHEFSTLTAKITFLEARLLDMSNEVEEEGEKCWKVADARNWAGMLQALNPTTKIPEVTAEQYRGIDAAGNPLHGQ